MRFANGQKLKCDQVVPNLTWCTQGHVLSTNMRVLDLGAYNGVLGMDWLDQYSPMNCHWEEKHIPFVQRGLPITLQGVRPSTTMEITARDVEILWRWHDANEIWAVAMLDPQPTTANTDDMEAPPTIRAVLTVYEDVFVEPHKLSPQRQYDHANTSSVRVY